MNKEEASHTVDVSHKNSAVKDERKPKSVLVRSKDSLANGAKITEEEDVDLRDLNSSGNMHLPSKIKPLSSAPKEIV